MAVYTALSEEELTPLLDALALGELLDLQGSADGVENTTYFLTTAAGPDRREDRTATEEQWVLTLFEQLPAEELPYFVDLTTFLNRQELPVPCPLTDWRGEALFELHGKPGLMFPRLPGRHPASPSPVQCRVLGQTLAQLHLAGRDFRERRANPRGLPWLRATRQTLDSALTADDRQALDTLFADSARLQHLPSGVIHADLFRDNSLFDGERLTGLIDWYFACDDWWLLDLAVAVNDWCFDQAALQPARYEALTAGYALERHFYREERAAWPTVLQLAAARFWLSRLLDQQQPPAHARPGSLRPAKPPAAFRDLFHRHRQHPLELP